MPRSILEFSKIVLLGSSVRALAQSCRQLKTTAQPISIWAIDQFADQDCIVAVDKVSQMDLEDVSASLIGDAAGDLGELLFLPGGGTENHVTLIQDLAGPHCWCGTTGESLRSLRDPLILFDVARQAGLKAPLTYSHKTHPNRQSFATQVADLDKNLVWLWKSSNKGGGLGVSKIHSKEEFAYFSTQNETDFLQQFVPGAPYGATIIISANGRAEWIGACRLLTASDSLTQMDVCVSKNRCLIERVFTTAQPRDDFPFLFAGAIGPCKLPLATQNQLLSFAENSYRQFGIRGWFQVDFILDEHDQAWVLEVNPRWSATMEVYERALGISLTAKHLTAWDIDVFATTNIQLAKNLICWKDVLYADDDFLWTTQHEQRVTALNVDYCSKFGWPLIADIPNGQQSFAPGMPIFSVIAIGSSFPELLAARHKAHSVLRW